jgi:hypothetical protein
MRLLVTSFVVASLLAVSAASALAPAPNVRGTVVRTTAAGDCYSGEPCDPLPPAIYVVFSRGSTSTRARLGANGSFSLHLAAGSYSVTVAPPLGRALTPGSVRVPRVGVIRPRLVERNA